MSEKSIPPEQIPVDGRYYSLKSIRGQEDFYREFSLKEILAPKNIENLSKKLIYGIFLYTDVDKEMIHYIRENLQELDKISGDWSEIYVLEKPDRKWWNRIISSDPTKPFNRRECYDIARKFKVSFEYFPCLVLLPPLTKISKQKKLVIPIRDISKEYFRKLFSTLESIIQETKNKNKYEAVQIEFESIIKYLQNNSQEVIEEKTTQYNINGNYVIVNAGNNNEAIINQQNYSIEQRQTLEEAGREIQALLEQFSQTHSSSSPQDNLKVAAKAIENIDSNSTLKTRLIHTLKITGTKALKEFVKHPAVDVLLVAIEAWSKSK